MKRTTIVIFIMVVIALGFYLGYNRSQSKRTVEFPTASTTQSGISHTAGTTQPIQLEYKLAPSANPGYTISGFNSTLNIKGTLSLKNLIETLFLNDRTLSWNSYYLEVNPNLEKRKYQINLSIPRNEPTLKFLNAMGKEIGFTTQVSETTMQFYRAIRNDKPIAFSVSQSGHSMTQGLLNGRCKFTGIDFDKLFMQYKFNGIFIENATGVTDKFDIEVLIDKNNPDAMKADLQTKAGIDLIPFDKTIKLIKIY